MSGSVTSGVFQVLEADDPPMVAGYRIAARLGAGAWARCTCPTHLEGEPSPSR